MRAKEFISEVGAGTKQQFKAGDSNAEIPRIAAGMGKDNSYDPDKYMPSDDTKRDKNSGMVSIKTGDNQRDIYNQQGGVARVGSASGMKDVNMNTGQTLRSQSPEFGGTTVEKDHVAGTTTTNTNISGVSQQRTTKDGSGQELKNKETYDMGTASVSKDSDGNADVTLRQADRTIKLEPAGKNGKVNILQKDGSYRQADIRDIGTNPNDANQELMARKPGDGASFNNSQADSYGARGKIAPGTAMKQDVRTKGEQAKRVPG